ncbi:MAG: hypothetical protein R3D98_17640 [Candidatus Krumholzibacteriia bacterium]
MVLDQGSLGRAQLEKLAPIMHHALAAVVGCGDAPGDRVTEILAARIPRLDLTFTPAELAAVMAMRAAPERRAEVLARPVPA